jgi:predicted adenine nucleotide alpha hydrolase (AANH) superfamily ATPase
MSSEDENVHEFTQNELNKMLYFWDDNTEPVQEYHYMKLEWLHAKKKLQKMIFKKMSMTMDIAL